MATKKAEKAAKNNFLAAFKKEIESDGIITQSEPPRYWFSTGNYVQNYIMSGSFKRAIPQGRIVSFSGFSGSGKSYNIASACASAQQELNAYVLVVDSEGALDDDYMTKCGVDVNSDQYAYAGVNTFEQCIRVVGGFIKSYREEYGNDPGAPPVLIAIDSIDMMNTNSAADNYQKGVLKGDQGQRSKVIKGILRDFVHDIKNLNITIITANQVYKNQDPIMSLVEPAIITEAAKYAASIIVVVTKIRFKDKKAGDIRGIKMKCQGYKTRFTKIGSEVTIELDWERGINKCSGLAEVAIQLGVLKRSGARLAFTDETLGYSSFFEKDMDVHAEKVVDMLENIVENNKNIVLEHTLSEGEEIVADNS